MVKISDFRLKDVINVKDGKKLGSISDLDIHPESGKIEAIIIAGHGKMLSLFNKEDEIVIPWRDIVQIGEDVILVKLYQDQQQQIEYNNKNSMYK